MDEDNQARLAQSLREQIKMTHDVMLQCAEINAKRTDRPVPNTTPRGLVLAHGFSRFVGTTTLPKGVRKMKQRECFSNASHLVMTRPERFIYCEGYAVYAKLGIVVGEHAWVLDRDNDFSVVDPTWRDFAPGAYLGLPIKQEYLYAKLCQSRYYGLLYNLKLGCCPLNDPVEDWLQVIERKGDF